MKLIKVEHPDVAVPALVPETALKHMDPAWRPVTDDQPADTATPATGEAPNTADDTGSSENNARKRATSQKKES